MFFKVILSVLLTWIPCIASKIIINQNEFVMEVPFEKIQHAVRFGYMKCGVENENKNLKVNENIYNGTHIIFGYDRFCRNISGIDHSIKENVYKEGFDCFIYLIDPIASSFRCSGVIAKFLFKDTCAIVYEKACDEEFLGPCIGKFEENPNEENSAAVFLQFDNDTVRFSSNDIQKTIGKVTTCNVVQHLWKEGQTQYDTEYQIFFRYGNGTCAIDKTIFDACSCCFPALVGVPEIFGQKVDKKPVKKNEKFSR